MALVGGWPLSLYLPNEHQSMKCITEFLLSRKLFANVVGRYLSLCSWYLSWWIARRS